MSEQTTARPPGALSPEELAALHAQHRPPGLFQRAGIATVICGPGSINQAHQADEYVSLAQLAQCERFIARLRDERL